MRLLLSLLLLSLVAFAPVSAYVIGVAPATKSICVKPNDTALVNLTVSGNATADIILNVTSNVSWAQTWPQMILQSGSAANLPVLFDASNLTEGNYSGQLFICAPTAIANSSGGAPAIVVKYCIGPLLTMSVDKNCTQHSYKLMIQLVLLATAIIILCILLLRYIYLKRRHHGHV